MSNIIPPDLSTRPLSHLPSLLVFPENVCVIFSRVWREKRTVEDPVKGPTFIESLMTLFVGFTLTHTPLKRHLV